MSEPVAPEEDPEIWEEIMRSPLDPDPDEERTHVAQLLPVALAAIVGLLLGYVLNGPTEAAEPIAGLGQTTTSTTEVPPPPDPIFPPGYADATDVGIKALGSFTNDNGLFMIVSSATRSDLDRTETNEFHVAEWILAGDGVESAAARTIHSDLSPGVRLVEFPNVAGLPISGPELLARQATEMTVRTSCSGCAATSVDMADGEVMLEGASLPYTNTEPLLISVGSGLNLSIDELQATPEWGFAAWRLLGENDATVRVSLAVVFEGTDDPASEELDPTLLVPPHWMGPTPQNTIGGNPGPFSRRGTQQLDRVGEILSESNQAEQIVLRWTVEWRHPVGDPIPLPLDDVADLGSIE